MFLGPSVMLHVILYFLVQIDPVIFTKINIMFVCMNICFK